ncbi:hypothetical protein EBAPG3_010890 [Nitrosospira lacus]|uniref:Hint domain-containing protein n=1 Tax=Nitrosospira lacus TaxID=1288494 RepID=A0A1W6SR44_9PROT|nr:hypothetical protein [Nitrosospira lacus]ARO88245.1 hypothetical protein EBAPG3_010890 [Nitrosospira lacus]
MAVGYCGDGFCIPEKKNIDVTCHDLGKEAGKWIMYQVNGKTCYCVCSCLGNGTLVTLANGTELKVEDIIERKTEVKAAGKDLKFISKKVETLVGTNRGETKNTIYLKYRKRDGTMVERVVTMDHPFLLADKKLVGAGALQLKDRLIDEQGNPITIETIRWGSYIGQFWEFATSVEKPNANLDGHLVITEGVVTGDYAVSVYENYPTDAIEAESKGDEDRPVVGSSDWLERNVSEHNELDAAIEMEHGIFIPAAAFEVAIPVHASAFLPEIQAAILGWWAPKEPTSNQYLLDMCEYLIEFVFEPHYPDIKFNFNWYDDTVNSYSWVDTVTGQQNVYLSGGLARIKGFVIEGVSMVLAHEVGHLLGKPKLDGGVTCEGQADWFAASVALRTIWFGEEYFERLPKAIDQLELLYSYLKLAKKSDATLDITPAPEDLAGQPYPSNRCRINTYETAMTSPTAPKCSQCYPVEAEEEDEDQEDDLQLSTGDAKSAGARDRQRRKKALPSAGDETDLLAKISGARDRQRRKKRSLADEENLDIADGSDQFEERDEEDEAPEPSAKISGARDRQRRKKMRLSDVEEAELLAKISGARDRQRRKKRSLADEDDFDIADGSDQFEEGDEEDEALEPNAKISGARDRQRRKKMRLSDVAEAELLAKISGARDRQRRKKRSLADEENLYIADGSDQFEEGDEEDEALEPNAKISGARDRQRRKKMRLSDVAEAELLAKISGARDRQRRKKRSLVNEDDGGPSLLTALIHELMELVGQDYLAKIGGARDRQAKKKK